MALSSFMGELGGPTTPPPSAMRPPPQADVVLVNVTHKIVDDLERRLVKPVQGADGFLDWPIPDWLKLMRQHAKD